jgi:hypothetical protein
MENIDLKYYWEDNKYNIDMLVDFYVFNEKIIAEDKEALKIEFKNEDKKIAVAANGNIAVGVAVIDKNNQIEKFSIVNFFKDKEKEKEFKDWIQKS